MAAFGEKSFSYARYAANRPIYPQAVYNIILKYHQGPRDTLLDLGSGHGISTRALAPHFSKAIATDPSDHMLSLARSLSDTADPTIPSPSNIEFRTATSDSLPFLPRRSISAVISSQAPHWFPYPATWRELARVVRPGGTLAFWGYSDPVLVGYPGATRVLHAYAYEHGGRGMNGKGEEQEWMGRYWSFPGRAIVEDLYRDLVPPESEGWIDVERVESLPEAEQGEKATARYQSGDGVGESSEDGEEDIVLRKRMRIKDFKEYVRTWSAFHNWAKANPEAQKRDGAADDANRQGDVIDWMVDAASEVEKDWKNEQHEVVVEWPLGLLLARRR